MSPLRYRCAIVPDAYSIFGFLAYATLPSPQKILNLSRRQSAIVLRYYCTSTLSLNLWKIKCYIFIFNVTVNYTVWCYYTVGKVQIWTYLYVIPNYTIFNDCIFVDNCIFSDCRIPDKFDSIINIAFGDIRTLRAWYYLGMLKFTFTVKQILGWLFVLL